MNNLGTRLLLGIARLISAFFNLRIKLKYVLLVIILLVGGTGVYTYKTMMDNVGGKADYNEAMRYIEIKDVLQDKYIDEVDRDSLGDAAAAAMVSKLNDRWSYYMSENEFKSYQLYSSTEYDNIGMSITEYGSGGFQVISVNNSSPAAWAGLSSGMVITSVDGVDVKKMSVDEVRTLIRSKLNTKFSLGIGNGKTVIEVDCSGSYVSPVSFRVEKTGAGYVQINNFEAGSGDDAVDAVEKLMGQGAIALVIDLRNNPGGLVSEVTRLLDYLLPNCTLFNVTDKQGHKESFKSDSMCVQLPMIVLVNGQTYSEAELFAAVLQENGWASVLGEATTGRTRTQETVQLSDGSAIRLSTGSYVTAKGTDISARGGVIPNYIVYNNENDETGTTAGTTAGEDGTASVSNDTQLMQALKQLS